MQSNYATTIFNRDKPRPPQDVGIHPCRCAFKICNIDCNLRLSGYATTRYRYAHQCQTSRAPKIGLKSFQDFQMSSQDTPQTKRPKIEQRHLPKRPKIDLRLKQQKTATRQQRYALKICNRDML